jgi:hypothetical protein
VDYDRDGEGDEPAEDTNDTYVLQEVPIVGGCEFRLNAPEQATLVVDSELTDWAMNIEIKREPGGAEDFKMYSGRTQIPGVKGQMRVIANFEDGNSPRSVKPREVGDGYRHEVQIPEEFRLLEITVTTPDGREERLERNARSASGAYITAHRDIIEPDDELPDWAINLAQGWLEKGYPQVSSEIVEQAIEGEGAGGGSPGWWMWAAIATWAVIVILATAGLLWLKVNGDSLETGGGRIGDNL